MYRCMIILLSMKIVFKHSCPQNAHVMGSKKYMVSGQEIAYIVKAYTI